MTEAYAAPAKRQTGSSAVVETAGTNLLLAGLSLVTGVLAARLLGPESRGHLAAAQTVGGLVGAIGALALGESLVYFVGIRRSSQRSILVSAVAFALSSTLIAILVAFFLMPLVLRGEPDAVTPARAYTLIGVTFVLLGFPITFMRARERFREWNVLRAIGPLSWLAALILLAANADGGVTMLILVFIGIQGLCIPVVWWIALRRTESGRVEVALLGPMLRYGAPLFLATLPLTLNVRLDQLFLANADSADQLGLYAVSVSWAALGIPLMGAIGSVLFPRLASSERKTIAPILARSSRAGVLIAGALAALSAVTAPLMIPLLFGREFAVPVMVSVVLAVATSLLGYNGLLEEGLRGAGEPKTVLFGEVAGLATTVVVLLLLVPPLGILGAALASLLGYATVTAYLVWATSRRVPVPVRALIVPTRHDLAGMGKQAMNAWRAASSTRGRP